MEVGQVFISNMKWIFSPLFIGLALIVSFILAYINPVKYIRYSKRSEHGFIPKFLQLNLILMLKQFHKDYKWLIRGLFYGTAILNASFILNRNNSFYALLSFSQENKITFTACTSYALVFIFLFCLFIGNISLYNKLLNKQS